MKITRNPSMNLLCRTTGEEPETYERLLGTSPQEVRDQETRVHERAADLAQASAQSREYAGPTIEGETVHVHEHDSEDRNQDLIHSMASIHLWR
jgi:hypothetical protein